LTTIALGKLTAGVDTPLRSGHNIASNMTMHEHKATIRWERTSEEFVRGRYSREHTWTFDGGFTVPASPSPHVIPPPWSNPASVDPEEAFVASVSSCHMLTFLWAASNAGFQLDSYTDEAAGVLTKNDAGTLWVSRITLRPHIVWSGVRQPTPDAVADLHHRAHRECFIANSIKTEVIVVPESEPSS